jgi:hypothetical protein
MGSDPKSFRMGSLVRDSSKILVANGKLLLAKARGTVDLALSSGIILSLYDVLYVPNLSHNLISVDALQGMKVTVTFPGEDEGGGCKLYKEGVMLEALARHSGLYSLGVPARGQKTEKAMSMRASERRLTVQEIQNKPSDVTHSVEQPIAHTQPKKPVECAMAAMTLDELHHRLGHASKDKLLHMLDKIS